MVHNKKPNYLPMEIIRNGTNKLQQISQRDVDRAETDLLINLSTLTQRGLAKMIGCHESKISRTDWRFIASVLCAFGMASDISPISRAFKYALDGIAKKKSPAATEDFKQIDMQF